MNTFERAQILKEKGNEYYSKRDFKGAINYYSESANLYTSTPTITEEEIKLLATLYNNRATCYFQLKDYVQTISDCNIALKFNPSYEKVIKRRFQANKQLDRFADAITDLHLLSTLNPTAEELSEENGLKDRCRLFESNNEDDSDSDEDEVQAELSNVAFKMRNDTLLKACTEICGNRIRPLKASVQRYTIGLDAGKSKGFAYVTFSCHRDAKESVKILNNSNIGGRIVTAKLRKNAYKKKPNRFKLSYGSNSPFSIPSYQSGFSFFDMFNDDSDATTPIENTTKARLLKEAASIGLNMQQVHTILDKKPDITELDEVLTIIDKLSIKETTTAEGSQQNNKKCINEDGVCKICYENPINCVISKCGHMVVCLKCSKNISNCPICRTKIVEIIKIFKS